MGKVTVAGVNVKVAAYYFFEQARVEDPELRAWLLLKCPWRALIVPGTSKSLGVQAKYASCYTHTS